MTSAQHRRWLLYQCVMVSLSALAMAAVLVAGVGVGIAGATLVPNDVWRRTPGAGLIGTGAILCYTCAMLYLAATVRSGLERRLAQSWGMFCDRCRKAFTWDEYQYFVAHNACSCSAGEPLAEWRVGNVEPNVAEADEVAAPASDNPYAPPLAHDPPKQATFQRPEATTTSSTTLVGLLWTLVAAFAMSPVLVLLMAFQGTLWPLFDRWQMWRSGAAGIPWLAAAAQRHRRGIMQASFSGVACISLVAAVVVGLYWLAIGLPGKPQQFGWLLFGAVGMGAVVVVMLPVIIPKHYQRQRHVSATEGLIIPYDAQAGQYRLVLSRPEASPDPLAFRFRTVGQEGVILNVYDEGQPQILLRAQFAGDPEDWRNLVLPLDQPTLKDHDQMKLRFVFDSADRKPWLVSDDPPKS